MILMSVFPDGTLVAGGCKVTSTQCGNTCEVIGTQYPILDETIRRGSV